MMALAPAPAQAAPPLGAILSGTPWWAYALLALLVFNGFVLIKSRAIPLWRLLVQPGIFLGWGIASLALAAPAHPGSIAIWVMAAAIATPLGFATSRAARWTTDRARGVLYVPGSPLPLTRSLGLFVAKYAIAVATALHAATPQSLAFSDMAVSGLGAGYFAGWLLRLVLAYRRDPALASSASPAAGNSSLTSLVTHPSN
jgi:hypothetical protein